MSVARTYTVPKPSEAKLNIGQNNLTRIHIITNAVANPISTVAINGLDSITANTPAPRTDFEVFSQGGRNRSSSYRDDYRFDGTMVLPSVFAAELFAQTMGISWGSGGQYALPISRIPDYPVMNVEIIQRAKDGLTVQMSKIYQDIIIKPFNAASQAGQELITIPIMSKFDPFLLHSTAELVTEVFQGDGSSVDFVLQGTPVTLVDKTANGELIDWVLGDMVYVKKWGASDVTGTRLINGVTQAAGTVTVDTALAASEYLEVCYAKTAA